MKSDIDTEDEQSAKRRDEPRPDIEADPEGDVGGADIKVDERQGVGGPDIKPEDGRS
ncbi:MAG TPA: hypothetical protein VM674_03925 [Candidatus Acidoferrum sp.]|nr:hypothetical protein [Candidatus Acidoferrum sp.]